MERNLEDLRREYVAGSLDERDVAPHPMEQFAHWFEQYSHFNAPDFTAVTLATVGRGGMPSARVVLLKSFDLEGFVFYTNYQSRKAQEMEASGHACLNFFWPELERQVRVEGAIERVPGEESDAYFATRPRGSQLGAWASPQSEEVASRAALEARWQAVDSQFRGVDVVPRPPHWGGYRVRPSMVEFWQGRESRLHDRIAFFKEASEWKKRRLAP